MFTKKSRDEKDSTVTALSTTVEAIDIVTVVVAIANSSMNHPNTTVSGEEDATADAVI